MKALVAPARLALAGLVSALTYISIRIAYVSIRIAYAGLVSALT